MSTELEAQRLSARRRIVRDAVAIGLATGAYGLSYGAIAVASGLSVSQASFLSLFAFTGASQFALVGVVGAGGSAVAAVAAALLLGARNTLYAVRLADVLGVRGAKKPLAAQLVIDETTAMAVAQPEPDEPAARSGTPAPPSSSAGTSRRSSARWPAI